MFSAASCGLSLLCDEALQSSSESDTASPTTSPSKRQCTHSKRVSFLSRDEIKEFEPLPEADPLEMLIESLLKDDKNNDDTESGEEEKAATDAHIDQRLGEAELNMERNKTPFRYRKPFVTSGNKRQDLYVQHGTDSADCASVHRTQAATGEEAFPIAREAATDSLFAAWMCDAIASGPRLG